MPASSSILHVNPAATPCQLACAGLVSFFYNDRSLPASVPAGNPLTRTDGMKRTDIRNVAIIAHVDHGKTTLVDQLMRQSGLFREGELRGDCILDSSDLERQRGITILSKNIALTVAGTKINIIDTPGHADFGGEVERVLKMADGALLLIDAKDGPMPQTRFVLKQALKMKLKIIVVVNKVDLTDARPDWVLGKTFDLFLELGADEASTNFPIVYASAKN